jgi:hypothetical protein
MIDDRSPLRSRRLFIDRTEQLVAFCMLMVVLVLAIVALA